jgi:hypothetical protein
MAEHPPPIPEGVESGGLENSHPAGAAPQPPSFWKLEQSEWDLLIASTAFKLLLFPA